MKNAKQFVAAFRRTGSIKGVARMPGMSYRRARQLYLQAVEQQLMDPLPVGRKSREATKKPEPKFEGRLHPMETPTFDVPPRGQVRRHIFTCAQNNATIHVPLWKNLLALAEHYDAKIHVARFTYIKSGLGATGDKAQYTNKETLYGGKDVHWAPEIVPYLHDERAEIAPGLVWCGEMNILPTASRPLSGLEVYTGRKSAILPHVKFAMESIPSGKREATKFNYTTGTVTMRNYIQRKAGLKAEFHHCYGALLVEVDSDGDWFVRQLNADSTGTIYDLDLKVHNGEITTGHRVEAINWGDIHVAQLEPMVARLAWENQDSMANVLRPRYQFFHDVLDFRSRSHHETKDPHTRFKRFVQQEENVKSELVQVAAFLLATKMDDCRSVIIDSNHHHHLARWLKEQDGRLDPVNAEFWFAMNERIYNLIRAGTDLNYLREGVHVATGEASLPVTWVNEDESYVICPTHGGGIECGMHGDTGPGGGFGGPLRLARLGRKSNIGHTHAAGIYDGVYVSGTSSTLTPDWTHGPSNWSWSHIVTYENGKRAIYTMWNDKWRAK